jgi:hypothetical protein
VAYSLRPWWNGGGYAIELKLGQDARAAAVGVLARQVVEIMGGLRWYERQ